MLGYAQNLFLERKPTSWKPQKQLSPKNDWPLLNRLLSSSLLPQIDYLLAEMLLSNYPEADETVAAFICHLSLSARCGHLCIKVDLNEIFPAPSIWLSNSSLQASPFDEDIKLLFHLIQEGASKLPKNLFTEVTSHQIEKIPKTPLCRFGNYYYLQRFWVYESFFLHNFRQVDQSEPKITFDSHIIKNQLDILINKNLLLLEQAEAIKNSAIQALTIISGGPGTGKTYTAGLLIKVLWNSLPKEEKAKYQIVFAAPTGKAAANLQMSLTKFTMDLEGFAIPQAKTLHSLLGLKANEMAANSSAKLSADLIVIDESSMIDVRLMTLLFASIKPGARLVLLGDPNQLPSVEAGSLFADLIELRKRSENKNKYPCELKKCLRAELQSIIDLAETVKEQNSLKAMRMLTFVNPKNLNFGLNAKISETQRTVIPTDNASHESKILFINLENINEKEFQKTLFEYANLFFPKTKDFSKMHPKELLEKFNQFRILSPLRKGAFGVDEINAFFIQQLSKQQTLSQNVCIDPIMLIHNDVRLELYNGEVGLLVRNRAAKEMDINQCKEGDYAIFPSKDHKISDVFKIPALLLPKFEYAYCISVHKSQGSEFDHVLLLMPEGAQTFGNEVMYTGITRARKKLEIWGTSTILSETISKQSRRLSGIKSIREHDF